MPYKPSDNIIWNAAQVLNVLRAHKNSRLTLREIREETGLADRTADRALQKLRREKLAEYQKPIDMPSGWKATKKGLAV